MPARNAGSPTNATASKKKKSMGSRRAAAPTGKATFADAKKAVSSGSLRRLARRGGVKRLSAASYEHVRAAMLTFLRKLLSDCYGYVEVLEGKTVMARHVVWSLKGEGRPLYGIEERTRVPKNKSDKKGKGEDKKDDGGEEE